jgi:hypothetical protein
MKALLSVLTFSMVCVMALAQEKPANPQSQPAPAGQQTATQPSDKTGSASTPAEMKTSTFKGVLVDMSCASPAAGAQPAQPADTGKTKASDESNTANRSASESGTNCPVSASSTNFGMKLDDGRTVRFDLVGNQRAQDEVKNNKRWNKAISENKTIQAKVSGVLNGDKLIVSSIH